MSNDIAIGTVAGMPAIGTISKKPSYLVILEDLNGKNRVIRKFITVDKPEFLQGFIQVKGFFCDLDEEEISKKFMEVLTSTSKELICEMLFPWHKICHIKSLVFKQK
jgi:hypothetical protein